MQIKKKADGWIVMDEKGLHRYKTKEEAEAHAKVAPVMEEPEEEAEVEEDE